jgi:hypothetical protein
MAIDRPPFPSGHGCKRHGTVLFTDDEGSGAHVRETSKTEKPAL